MTGEAGGPMTGPAAQQAIWERCRHSTGAFLGLPPAEVEQSMPERFATRARRHGDRPAVLAPGTVAEVSSRIDQSDAGAGL